MASLLSAKWDQLLYSFTIGCMAAVPIIILPPEGLDICVSKEPARPSVHRFVMASSVDLVVEEARLDFYI